MNNWKECKEKIANYRVREPEKQVLYNGKPAEPIQTNNGVFFAVVGTDLVIRRRNDIFEKIISKEDFEKQYEIVTSISSTVPKEEDVIK
jgi:hypothetical protein